MKFWSRKWKSSTNPGKQRKYVYNAPMHVRRKLLAANLSEELRKKYSKRSFPVRKGDEVEIMRGEFKKKKGKINRISVKKTKIYIDGITRKKVDGSDISVSIQPSNLRIISLDLGDEERLNAFNKNVKKVEKNGKKTPKKAVSSKLLESEKKGDKVRNKTKARSS
ncbi:MAG: 50S ribosomal protein L24 [Candidatus Aenigmarchaeota archaeon CG_4_10_14_0_8_um_filter_37_24]|nr:50S ribosomal protein L24 [Candidatus Aenigmarchaeota archaeon]OIN86574.1 MAG: 50S ribosomal protein L24 [Candidatus Aenigmarchaeota archaeon CG1_02_38_14]PIV69395.1 MAG: 50S ribosomal protein L24 [Candidatus Aenigmarchaeota archaeon CG01_land_8_20_14_3_00_37_9]PIW41709.1 MAG: 50S ribosomal protein L24 [Candidatus Aenigmarchaeota archaeon CG15_BIG_FIL_POST_REV_8_21_14_020_37_27]PIX50544.1 MAG: 50S ribosomal protein L24 [Candidatus Aenigmarchaeota archaeon CG_4_8_14_3_um_filter_37_24]PIY3490